MEATSTCACGRRVYGGGEVSCRGPRMPHMRTVPHGGLAATIYSPLVYRPEIWRRQTELEHAHWRARSRTQLASGAVSTHARRGTRPSADRTQGSRAALTAATAAACPQQQRQLRLFFSLRMRVTSAAALNDGGTCYGDRHQLNVAHNLVASKLMFPPLASNVMPAGLGEPSKLDSL